MHFYLVNVSTRFWLYLFVHKIKMRFCLKNTPLWNTFAYKKLRFSMVGNCVRVFVCVNKAYVIFCLAVPNTDKNTFVRSFFTFLRGTSQKFTFALCACRIFHRFAVCQCTNHLKKDLLLINAFSQSAFTFLCVAFARKNTLLKGAFVFQLLLSMLFSQNLHFYVISVPSFPRLNFVYESRTHKKFCLTMLRTTKYTFAKSFWNFACFLRVKLHFCLITSKQPQINEQRCKHFHVIYSTWFI